MKGLGVAILGTVMFFCLVVIIYGRGYDGRAQGRRDESGPLTMMSESVDRHVRLTSTDFALTVLRRDARFANVGVHAHSGLGDDVLVLDGWVKTEADKWDARDAIWRAIEKEGRGRPKGILNNIWSHEFRDMRIQEQDARRAPPVATGSCSNLTGPRCW